MWIAIKRKRAAELNSISGDNYDNIDNKLLR